MRNISLISIDYCWYNLNVEESNYGITFAKDKGHINPGDCADVIIQFTAYRPIDRFEDVFPCFMQDDKGKYFGVKVKGCIVE